MARRIRIAELVFYTLGFFCSGLGLLGVLIDVVSSITFWEGIWVLFLSFYMVSEIRHHEQKRFNEKYGYER